MKITVYSVASAEMPYFEKWIDEHDVDVELIHEPLSIDNLAKAEGSFGICVNQPGKLGDDDFYKTAHEMGIKVIGVRSAGVDFIDFAAAKKYDIAVTNVPIYSPRAIAEMGLTQALSLLRRIGEYQAEMAKGKFSLDPALLSNEIFNLTVGVIGMGNIGAETARLYRALGAKVVAYNRSPKVELESIAEFKDLDDVIAESDILSLHLPMTPQTANMIGAAQLKAMKKNAILINMGRGGLVDTAALIDALKQGEIAGAGLDTITNEELYFRKNTPEAQVQDDYKELVAMPNVIITPHVAFFTSTAVKNMVHIGMNNILKQAK
ncbi:MAG: D-2-hydroxyacid dehydrogenase [Limosilactobacillus sp.]|uniref:D-2-hydroxyacid dehydrogenase n=1 Tax=Limosilactobacillus sp. TaxID=2773925 RepID=UPI0026F59BD9|nr:D-2-hydroxyacid dehydrogenase [Limosilactobacillus sp.]